MRFIGITQRLMENSSYYEIREALSIEWGELFSTLLDLKGFLPLPLSYGVSFEKYATTLSGVILSGGNDLSAFSDSQLSLKRDSYEKDIIHYCIENKLPLLGVCRGSQMIAYYFNSTLQSCNGHVGEHSIKFIPLNGEESKTFKVNSFHNYSITALGDNLQSLAIGEDGSIEAFRHESLPIFAMLWHLEREKHLSKASEILLHKWLESIH